MSKPNQIIKTLINRRFQCARSNLSLLRVEVQVDLLTRVLSIFLRDFWKFRSAICVGERFLVSFSMYTICFDKNLEVLLSKFQICTLKLLEWFSNNYMKINSDKCHLILSSCDENNKTENNDEVINKSQVQKLLGVYVDYELKSDIHIETLCEKVGPKLLALSQFINFMFTNEAQLLMRSFIMSQFSYCRLTWMSK